MDAFTPHREDDLNDVERCLAGWQPAAESLDADAMLFAAGRAAGRRGSGRVLWPALCSFLVVLSVGLGVWGLRERTVRQTLADHSRERASAPSVVVLPASTYTPSPDDYFHLRRLIEQDPNRWLASLQPEGSQLPEPPPGEPPILTPRQRDGLLAQ